MDERLKLLNQIIPKHFKHRVTIIDMLYVLTSTGKVIEVSQVETFIKELAKEKGLTFNALISEMDDEIDYGVKQGIDASAQFDIFNSKLT